VRDRAAHRPARHPHQAWIESLSGHVKAGWPHLDRITDPAVLRAELADVRQDYNTVRLHAGIGYVTPEDEHQARGPRIRAARKRGLRRSLSAWRGCQVAASSAPLDRFCGAPTRVPGSAA
jgi:hypothetical protein